MSEDRSQDVRDKTVAFAAGYGTLPPAALQRIEELLRVNFYTFIGDDTQVVILRATTQEGLHEDIQGITAPCNVVLNDIMGTELMTGFLHSCTMVVSCTIADPNVTKIGECVLARSSMVSLDLSRMKAVAEIGDDFLDHCHSLASLDMSGMGAVTRIGDGFLADCFSLKSLDLSGLRAVSVIGQGFIRNCPSLCPCPTRESVLLQGAPKK